MAMTEAAKREFTEVTNTGIVGEESGGGIALVVLGILALAKVDPILLDSIAVIVAGVTLFVGSVALSAKYGKALAAVAPENINVREMSGGISAGVMGGAAGVVLGILAILGIAGDVLISIALIVFGAAVLFDFVAKTHVRALQMLSSGAQSDSARMAFAAASSTNTATVLVAVSIVTLGILGLASLVPEVLAAAAFLALGTYLVLDSTAAAGWMMEMITY